jgi:hypothetical protein
MLGEKFIQIEDKGGFDKQFVESVINEQIIPRLGPLCEIEEDISCYFK